MPFNKGDFTQQGVAGHVNANLRLNEKRYVYLDLTSNENDEGCTISGAVADPLNNEVYPIGSAVSGNIEITENGENINVAQYATATVNVSGGGDSLLKLSVTIKNDDESVRVITESDTFITIAGSYILNQTITNTDETPLEYSLQPGESATFDILYIYDTPQSRVVTWLKVSQTTASNVINLTLDDTDPNAPYYYPTDYTANSSVTLTYKVTV